MSSSENSQFYTPAMLAEILGISVRDVRRWHRAGILPAAAEVMQLPQFDYEGLIAARQLSAWTRQGATVQSIRVQLTALKERSGCEAPIQQLPITADGKRLVLRQGDQFFEASGQLRFAFDNAADNSDSTRPVSIRFDPAQRAAPAGKGPADRVAEAGQAELEQSLESMIECAIAAEEAFDLEVAIQWYRTALAVHGPNADLCFQLAELLYRVGDIGGARERYFMALELDPELVEARANLGCVLAESGQTALAIAAFEGTLQQYAEYADVHFHLARVLDEVGEPHRAVEHWQTFLELAPASPWADEAQQRLEHCSTPVLEF
jgi:tetratricopeptide (TPR) repeat protein